MHVLPQLILSSLYGAQRWLSGDPAIPLLDSHAHIQVETDPTGQTWPWRVFKSSPHTPPNMTITGNGGELAEGFIFMTPQVINTSIPATKQNGGFIMTVDGDMVFALDASGVTDFRVQVYQDARFLTYWSGYNTEKANIGHGYGRVNFVDSSYHMSSVNPDLGLRRLAEMADGNCSIDIHEHHITPRDTLLVSAYNNTPRDLSTFGGPVDGWIADSMVFELDLSTWDVLFSWAASDHVPLSESRQPITNKRTNATRAAPWDWFHVNSIELVGEDYLVNGRHTWSAYMISGKDGSVIWRLEGESGGDFGSLPTGGNFRWQHLAQAHNVTDDGLDLSIFNNHNSAVDFGTGPSNGLVLHLDLPANKHSPPVLLRKIDTPSEQIYADSQGSYHAHLDNGNQLMGYGQIAITREYGPGSDGSDLRWQAQFGGLDAVQSYRAFKQIWHATPANWDPNLVIVDGYAYVSWNGATDVTSWNVYTDGETTPHAVASKRGFETVFKVPRGVSFLQVGAVQRGVEVRLSNIVKLDCNI